MKNSTRWILLASIAVIVCAVTWNFSPTASSRNTRKGQRPENTISPKLDNFDIRITPQKNTEEDGAAQDATSQKAVSEDASVPQMVESDAPQQRPTISQEQSLLAATVRESMSAAKDKLIARLPDLKVDYNETLHVPEVVSIGGGMSRSSAGKSTKSSQVTNESMLRTFLTENAALYGLTPAQASQLKTVSDYTNPAGNLSFVELQQEINGIPVFQGYVRGIVSKDGRLVRTTGLLAAGLRSKTLLTVPTLSATDAVAAGARSINVGIDANSLKVVADLDSNTKTVSRGPFDEDTKTDLVYFQLAPGTATLAYSMVLWQPDVAYTVIVDASTGKLLWRKCITQDQTQAVTYNIYNNDSPEPLSPSTFNAPTTSLPPGITRTSITEISENPTVDNLGWIPDGSDTPVTTGNNVDAGLDLSAPNGIDTNGRATASAGRVFNFPYRPDGSADPTGSNDPTDTNYRMGAVTNLFFWTNRYHDLIYNYGFTEPARNFQTNNFGRGGLGNDSIRAEAQDSSGTNNANFSTPGDGSQPRMQMYIFTTTPNRDGDLDADVFLHEMTHGTSNRLHNNGNGLNANQSGGMGEGWSDYYGRALLSTADEDVNAIYAMGAYVTKDYYHGIRRFPYAVKSNVGPNGKPHNPLTFADIDPAQLNITDGAYPPNSGGAANEVHNIGEFWCMTLLEMRARLITRLGFAAGNPRAIQIVTDGMKLDPVNPTVVNSRDSILAADCAGFGGADELDIWEGFRTRGAGFRASTDGTSVVENFEGPNLTVGNITSAEASGSGNSNGDGSVDPGETVLITVPVLNNRLCATDGTDVSVTIANTSTGNYGTIAHGSSATQTIAYTVPTTTACGSVLPLTITVNSSNLGPINYSYNLLIGQTATLAAYENFDGVTAPALPAGWTTARTGAGPFWTTSTTNPDTAPNDAFAPSSPNTGTTDLISPPISINTATGRVDFRNSYNLENGLDSLSLQIKIGNGAFQDIIAAGGSFIAGGYNGTNSWTGLSGGTTDNPAYITTSIKLPISADGKIIQLRWRLSNNGSGTAPGQAGARIDTILIATTAQPCTPFGSSSIIISGQVTNGTTGVNGIQVTLSGTTNETATTTGNGNYSFNNLAVGGNYTVTPTTPGYEYTPPSRSYTNLNNNVTNANFTLVAAPSISGRVTNGTLGIDGITVVLSGTQSATTVTSGGGFYTFSPLTRGGNYTVTPVAPSGNNSNFSPPSRTVNNLNGPVTNVDFVATEQVGVGCTPVSAPITGAIGDANDLSQDNRLGRDGTPSTCSNKLYPGELAADPGIIRYDVYHLTNPSPVSACIKVTFQANFATVHSMAYLDHYDTNNRGVNFLGDLGVSYTGNNVAASYSFTVPANAGFDVVVEETSPSAGGTYTLTFGCDAIVPAAQAGQVLISEFRPSGAGTGATPNAANDEYVELYNNTDAPINVGGFALSAFNPATSTDRTVNIAAGTIIPRRGHLLIASSVAGGYSLGAYATANLTYATVNFLNENQGVALLDSTRTVAIDAVGFVGNSGNVGYIEGVGLPTTNPKPAVQYAYVRKLSNNTLGSFPQDTGDNSNDFRLVSVTGEAFASSSTPVQSVLGAPGPENSSSPNERSSLDVPALVDPTSPSSGGENRKRLFCDDPNAPPCPADPNTSTNGYLSIRRSVTNNTGTAITRLRFRIIDITTLGSPGAGAGQADLRAITSSAITATIMGSPTQIQGTTLETPPTQVLGGGVNSSLNVDSIALATPLASGQTVNVQFMLGVKSPGAFRFFVDVESLP